MFPYKFARVGWDPGRWHRRGLSGTTNWNHFAYTSILQGSRTSHESPDYGWGLIGAIEGERLEWVKFCSSKVDLEDLDTFNVLHRLVECKDNDIVEFVCRMMHVKWKVSNDQLRPFVWDAMENDNVALLEFLIPKRLIDLRDNFDLMHTAVYTWKSKKLIDCLLDQRVPWRIEIYKTDGLHRYMIRQVLANGLSTKEDLINEAREYGQNDTVNMNKIIDSL